MIIALRDYYELPSSVTDKKIEQKLKGSLGEAIINIRAAKHELSKVFREAVPNIFKKRLKR